MSEPLSDADRVEMDRLAAALFDGTVTRTEDAFTGRKWTFTVDPAVAAAKTGDAANSGDGEE